MRRLNELYWNKFTKKDSKGKVVRDGILFEDLVECLLIIQYGQHWIRTPKSHDNNRDFHLTTPELTHWAECKNYTNTIALDTIAPTLVMAQIFDVNKLIFFSYSDINFSAKKKILSFADKTKKDIEIFSGDTLDNLIIRNTKFLPHKFQPQNEHLSKGSTPPPLEYSFFFIQTPILGVTLEDRNVVSISEVQKILYNTIFEIAFICVNNSLDNDYIIQISLDEKNGKDNLYFTLVDYELENSPETSIAKPLPIAGGILNRYFFKSNRFKSFLRLPVLHVNILKGNKIVKSFCSPIQTVKNQWIGKTILIGEQYRNAIKKFEEYTLNNDQFSCLMLYGSSGTGKTRLLKEMLDVLLKYKYRIASFIGNENDSVYVLLKELVFFVYEVPRDEILKNLEEDIFIQEYSDVTSPAILAYQLAQRFSRAQSDSELIEIIDESFDILFEKISREHIAIVIDNIQFFGDVLIHFLRKYIIYSKHQTRANTSVLLLALNQDYGTEETSRLLSYMQDLGKNKEQVGCIEVTGFREENQGILFLRELLHIGDDRLDSEFTLILSKASLKPYFIYQAVYYLYEEGALLEDDDKKGFFPYQEKLHDTISKMPPQIYNIISERWNIFLKKNWDNKSEIISMIASVYLFRELTADIIDILMFDETILALLCRHMFLKQNEKKCYCFDHDIIENFFMSQYNNMNILVIDRIRKYGAESKILDYPFVYVYFKLYETDLTSLEIHNLYKKTSGLSIHSKLVAMFFSRFIKVLLQNKDGFEDELWMSMVFGICNMAKNRIGIQEAEYLYETVNSFLGREIPSSILLTNSFRNYMNIYADILFFQRRYKDAIIYLKTIQQIPLHTDNDQANALRAMTSNRLLINYRELPTEYHQTQAQKCLSDAVLYTSLLNNPLLKDEFTFLNISDEGYNYYCMYKEKEKLLSIWKRCMEYPPERLPQKAMNYYRKCMQIYLIEQNYYAVYDAIQEATEYMDVNNTSSMERLNFSLSFSLYEIMALIQENPIKNKEIIQKKIHKTIELARLMSQRNLHHLFALNALVCYYNGDIKGTYYYYKDAYNLFIQKRESRFFQDQKSLLLANIYVSFKKLNMFNEAKNFLMDNDWNFVNHVNITLSDYEAKGIQRTSDRIFNLPCV